MSISQLSYSQAGSGLPVVLIHGFPLDSRIWYHQVAGLSSTFRIITPDLRGFGQSHSTDPFTIESLADDVHDLLHTLSAIPCILAGLSMGGYVALAYATRYIADLKGLVLIDTKSAADTPEAKSARNQMIELARTGSKAVADQMEPKMLAPSPSPQIVQQLRTIMDACPVITIQHAVAAMRDRPDYTSTLKSLKIPTLFITGQHDAITPPALAEAMQKQTPNSKLEIIPAAGHMSPIEQPDRVNTVLRQFLSQFTNSI